MYFEKYFLKASKRLSFVFMNRGVRIIQNIIEV